MTTTMTSERFRKIRHDNGLTQSQLATALRINDLSIIWHWEKGYAQIPGPVSLLMEAMEKLYWQPLMVGGIWGWQDYPDNITKGTSNA